MKDKTFEDIIYYENIFHDMKLPLTVVHTTIQLLDTMDLPGGVKDHLKAVENSCYRIMKLINDATDMARVEKGQLIPSLANHDLVFLINTLTENTYLLADKKNISLTFSSNALEKVMATDKAMLERILLNLLSNAIKFTETGGKIEVYLGDDRDFVEIIVRDTGIGIEADKIEEIFDRYITSDRQRGHGLGLGIVKELTQALNGEVFVIKTPAGTEFVVRLPAVQIKEPKRKFFVEDFYKENIVQIELSEHY